MDMQHGEMGEGGHWMKHRQYRAVRGLTAVIVLIFVFWLGVQLGEIRSSLGIDHNYGYRMMGGFGPGMMEYFNTSTSQAIPPTTVINGRAGTVQTGTAGGSAAQ